MSWEPPRRQAIYYSSFEPNPANGWYRVYNSRTITLVGYFPSEQAASMAALQLSRASRKTRHAIERWGYRACLRAYALNTLVGFGPSGIAQGVELGELDPKEAVRTTRQADMAINAGRELRRLMHVSDSALRGFADRAFPPTKEIAA